MTHAEAVQLARSLIAWGAFGQARITAEVIGDRIVFGGPGARSGTHSLDIATSSRDRVLAHWRGFVTTNGGVPTDPTPQPMRKSAAQLDREIATALRQPLLPPTPFDEDLPQARHPIRHHVRRLVVVTYWGDPQHKAGGRQQLGEFTTSDRYARAWLANSQRFAKYEIDTHQKGTAYSGGPVAPGDVPAHGVKSLRPATLKDLKRFHFKLREGHTLAESPELEAERANICMYCGKPTRKGSALIDGQTAHKSCIKEFEK